MVSSSCFTWFAAALVAFPVAHARHFIMGGTRAVVNTRLDPIVSPGQVSYRVPLLWSEFPRGKLAVYL